MSRPTLHHVGRRDVRSLAVVIPANNEAELIHGCLQAVCRARAALPAEVTCSIVVVADRCTDDTVAIARRALTPHDRIIESRHGCVGSARRVGVAEALRLSSAPSSHMWLASTDADTNVSREWLTLQLEYACSGAIGVAGIVTLDDDATSVLAERFAETYEIREDGTHDHVHGANLGLRADAYRAIGGWRSIASGEEHDLWNRLRMAGSPLSSSSLVVTTSSRLCGRAPDGFANNLVELCDDERCDPIDEVA